METGGIPVYVHIASLSPESSSETRGEAFIVVGERAFGMRMGLTPKALVAVAVLPHRRDVSKDLHRTHIKLRSDSSARRYVRLGNTCARGPTSQHHEGASARLDAPRTVSRRGSRFVGFIRRASAGPSPTCGRPVAGVPGTALAGRTWDRARVVHDAFVRRHAACIQLLVQCARNGSDRSCASLRCFL